MLDWSGFLKEMKDKDTGWWAFRGVCNAEYSLLPSIGRPNARHQGYSAEWEREIFERFKRQALPFMPTSPLDDFGWMAVAQHHGLPTRLLDWSRSPMVAAYFAAYAPPGADPDMAFTIYGYETTTLKAENTAVVTSPFDIPRKFVEVHIAHYVPRIPAQHGFFTVQSDPCKPLRPRGLRKWTVPGSERDDFMSKLDLFGINHSSLFPGLDGIAIYWNWYYRNVVGALPPRNSVALGTPPPKGRR